MLRSPASDDVNIMKRHRYICIIAPLGHACDGITILVCCGRTLGDRGVCVRVRRGTMVRGVLPGRERIR